MAFPSEEALGEVDEARSLLQSSHDVRGSPMLHPVAAGFLIGFNVLARVASGVLTKLTFHNDSDANTGLDPAL